jgi:hypothetical protein
MSKVEGQAVAIELRPNNAGDVTRAIPSEAARLIVAPVNAYLVIPYLLVH